MWLEKENCAIMVIDMQEKLLHVMPSKEKVIKNNKIFLKAAKEFSVPLIFTEQYPQGLGETTEMLKSLLKEAIYFEKMTFSALLLKECEDYLKKLNKKVIILTGIETHVCVLSTALKLLQKNYTVVVPADTTTSREKGFYNWGLSFLKQEGAKIMPMESIVFYWLKVAGTPQFKKVQRIILGKE
jgi:nicotinamidase-related amidase